MDKGIFQAVTPTFDEIPHGRAILCKHVTKENVVQVDMESIDGFVCQVPMNGFVCQTCSIKMVFHPYDVKHTDLIIGCPHCSIKDLEKLR